MEAWLIMKIRHPTSIRNIIIIQPFLSHCSFRSLYIFPTYADVPSRYIPKKQTVNSATETLLKLMAQMPISGRWALSAISVGNTSQYSKSFNTWCLCINQTMTIFASSCIPFHNEHVGLTKKRSLYSMLVLLTLIPFNRFMSIWDLRCSRLGIQL